MPEISSCIFFRRYRPYLQWKHLQIAFVSILNDAFILWKTNETALTGKIWKMLESLILDYWTAASLFPLPTLEGFHLFFHYLYYHAFHFCHSLDWESSIHTKSFFLKTDSDVRFPIYFFFFAFTCVHILPPSCKFLLTPLPDWERAFGETTWLKGSGQSGDCEGLGNIPETAREQEDPHCGDNPSCSHCTTERDTQTHTHRLTHQLLSPCKRSDM